MIRVQAAPTTSRKSRRKYRQGGPRWPPCNDPPHQLMRRASSELPGHDEQVEHVQAAQPADRASGFGCRPVGCVAPRERLDIINFAAHHAAAAAPSGSSSCASACSSVGSCGWRGVRASDGPFYRGRHRGLAPGRTLRPPELGLQACIMLAAHHERPLKPPDFELLYSDDRRGRYGSVSSSQAFARAPSRYQARVRHRRSTGGDAPSLFSKVSNGSSGGFVFKNLHAPTINHSGEWVNFLFKES